MFKAIDIDLVYLLMTENLDWAKEFETQIKEQRLLRVGAMISFTALLVAALIIN